MKSKGLIEQRRLERNKQLLEKMKKGEALQAFDKEESWYPRRPAIKKDPNALELLFREDDERK